MKNIKKIIIPAAGLGTRMLPATKSQPKEMLPVGRKPAIQYVVEEAIECGFRDLLIITGLKKHSIEDHFAYDELLYSKLEEEKSYLRKEVEFPPPGVNIFFVRQSVRKGLADAVFHARDFVGDEHFAVSLGDSIIQSKKSYQPLYSLMEDVHLSSSSFATVAVQRVLKSDISKYGIVKPRGKDSDICEIIDIHEKPGPEKAFSNLAIAGRYIFHPDIFKAIEKMTAAKSEKEEVDFTQCIKKLLDYGSVWCVCLRDGEVRYDIGNFESYYKAFFDMAISDNEIGEKLKKYIKGRIL